MPVALTTAEDPVKVEQAVGERKRVDLAQPPSDLSRTAGVRPHSAWLVCLPKTASFGLGPTELLLAAPLVQGPETITCWPWLGLYAPSLPTTPLRPQ